MKKVGIVSLCLFGFAAMAGAQGVDPAADAAVAAPVIAVEVPAAVVAAPVAEAAQELTIKGEVSVVNGPDGAVQLIFINPADSSHGFKVDLVNGEGKTLADKDGQIVEATGVDANRLFTIQTITVME